jgi:hypothetical protein
MEHPAEKRWNEVIDEELAVNTIPGRAKTHCRDTKTSHTQTPDPDSHCTITPDIISLHHPSNG